jgi:hypothetical protein
MHKTSFRLLAVASAVGLASVSAHANLTIPFGWTTSNSVQTFSPDDLDAFDLVSLTVEARGTATALSAGTPGQTNGTVTPPAFNFPITKIVIGPKLNIASGSAVGSALYFSRPNDTDGAIVAFTLANFTIDYDHKQVLADVTPKGGKVTKQAPIYNFHVATPLALKYKFPLTVTGHEVLDNLLLTPEAKAVFTTALQLPDYALPALELNYGTLVQDISTKARAKAVTAKPYVAP